MKYVAAEKKLYTDDDRLIKELFCPLNKEWDNLVKIEAEDLKRKCNACAKNVLDISSFSDERALIIAEYDPNVCVYINSAADNVEWIGEESLAYRGPRACSKEFSVQKDCRIIRTARWQHPMNLAASDGYKVLVKKVEDNPEIRSKMAVRQDSDSQHIEFIGDYRDDRDKLAIDFFFYNPSHHLSPVAAYLIPKDIKVGERVYILDLIENIVSNTWNQGDTRRQRSGFAAWNGTDFDIEPIPVMNAIG